MDLYGRHRDGYLRVLREQGAAFEWVSYLATGEGQKMWCEGTGNVPVSKTLQQTDFFQNNRFMKASIEGQS